MKKLLSVLLLLSLLLTGCGEPAAPVQTELPTEPIVTETATEPAPTEEPTEKPTEPPTTLGLSVPELCEDALVVTFIDVGQADCAFLACNGEYAIIDAGYPEAGPKVVDYLTRNGITALDLVVATHPHGDHIGGLPDVLNAFPTDTVWSSEIPYSNDYVRNFRAAVTSQGKSIQVPKLGEVFQLGEATITRIGPMRWNYENINNTSLVLMVEYKNTRFLFTGDMQMEAETDLLDSGADVKADLLKVGHHGSYTSTGYRLLREVAPTYGVICCGGNNDYGHPHDEPMSRLRDAEVILYRTDKMYTITVVSDGDNLSFSWENKFAKPGNLPREEE